MSTVSLRVPTWKERKRGITTVKRSLAVAEKVLPTCAVRVVDSALVHGEARQNVNATAYNNSVFQPVFILVPR